MPSGILIILNTRLLLWIKMFVSVISLGFRQLILIYRWRWCLCYDFAPDRKDTWDRRDLLLTELQFKARFIILQGPQTPFITYWQLGQSLVVFITQRPCFTVCSIKYCHLIVCVVR